MSCGGTFEETTYVFKLWAADSPAAGCPANTFGARFTKQVSFQGGSYTLHLQRAGQARMLLDGQVLIDLWQIGDGGLEATRALTGVHEVKIEFSGAQISPTLAAWWYGPGALPAAPAPDPSAWRAEYFGNYALWGQPAFVQNESGTGINHPWGDGGPGFGLPGVNWSARFTRDVTFACGAYHFTAHVDDALRLWVGDKLLIDEWRDQLADFSADINLTAGAQPVKVEYYQHGGGAALIVDWQLVSPAVCVAANPVLHPETFLPFIQ
jgi:PA14 domain